MTLFENQLKQLGIESVACMKAEEILGYLEHEHFDALFTDMQMPEMDGVSFLKFLRESHIALARKLPVVMVTARSDADQFLSEGFSGILHKPFSLAQLSFCLSGIWNEEATPREIEDEGEKERLRMILRLLRLLPKMMRRLAGKYWRHSFRR